ncbi:MAG TPA: hypothetical protein VKB02_06595 [Pyrinomonadaceae bacterium]|nr:hypothetical protein [Pyrinomonadaceae bacterium]
MKKPTLEQVIKLAAKLSPKDRQELFVFIAQRPDSAIKTSVEARLPLSPEAKKQFDDAAKTDHMIVVVSDKGKVVKVFQRGRLLFQVTFNPENFVRSRMEIHSWKDRLDTVVINAEVQRALDLMDKTDMTKTELEDHNRQLTLEVFEQHAISLAGDILRMLPTFARMLSETGVFIAEVGYGNRLVAQSGFPKITLEGVIRALEPEWKQIKEFLNVQTGGRINVRHIWSKVDHLCLHKNHERLKPIWTEAKKIARQARKSKETTRRQRWKEEVAKIYEHENLPDDLIDHAAPPNELPPSDLALLHAARICVPQVSPPYKLKTLRENLRLAKRK